MNAPGAAPSERFPRSSRIRRRGEFVALQRDGRRLSTPNFVVLVRRRANQGTRLGITTSRKVGNAPARNRVRRLVREFFRKNRTSLIRADVVVIAKPSAAALELSRVVHELGSVLGNSASS